MKKRGRRTNKEKRGIRRNRDYLKRLDQYEDALLGKGKKFYQNCIKLKKESLSVIDRVLQRISRRDTARYRVYGVPFPASYKDITNVLQIPNSDHIESELNWIACVLNKYANEINSYLKQKRLFDSCFLAGDYERASDLLKNIEDEFGCSLWLLEVSLLLAEYKGGLKSNREMLRNIISELNNVNICIFAKYLSFRAEKDVSSANYCRAFGDFLSSHAGNGEISNILKHFSYRLNFISFDDFESLSHVVFYEGVLPIIDRYLVYVRVLQTLASTCQDGQKAFLVNNIAWIRDFVSDISLDILYCYFVPDTEIVGDQSQLLLLDASDAYTVGDYARSLEISIKALNEYPDCFEFYEFFAKSSLHLQIPLDNPLQMSSLSYQILEHTYNVLEKNVNTSESIESLLKISHSVSTMRIGNQILAFVRHNKFDTQSLDFTVFGEVNATSLTPRFAMMMNDIEKTTVCLQNLKQQYSNNRAIDFFLATIADSPPKQVDILMSSIPEKRILKYQAKSLAKSKEFERTIAKLESLRDLNDIAAPYYEDVIKELFVSYLEVGQFEDCLHLIVNAYMLNKNLLLSINLLDFVDAHRTSSYKKNSGDICWPILESILQQERFTDRDSWKLYVELDDFLTAIGFKSPSEISIFDGDRQQFVYFLRSVCVTEVLDYSIVYKSSEDLENERIRICQMLLELDTSRAVMYSEEIRCLMREQMTRKAIQHIYKCRVHIDTTGIRNSLDVLFAERFRRCSDISRLDKLLRENPNVDKISVSQDDSPVVVFSDVSFTEFGALFEEIKSCFILSNEYGLDYYLSVRIRHGTLSGQIRSQFENENLITRKSSSTDNYDNNEYWLNCTFGAYGDKIAGDADQCLQEFSKQVDSVIEKVNSRLIQIRGNDDELCGLFDYDYNQDHLLQLWAQVFARDVPVTYDEFLGIVFSELWQRTETNLEQVRGYVRTELKAELTNALDELSQKICRLNTDFAHSQFSNAIVRCKTNIQNELEIIAGWFTIVDKMSFPDFEFEQVIDAASGQVRKCYQTLDFSTDISIDRNFNCLGKTFESLVDIMFIVLENIAKHSKPAELDKLQARIVVEFSDNNLLVEVINHLDSVDDLSGIEDLISRLQKPASNAVSMKLIRKEGGSGYYKICNILQHDLNREDYDVVFSVDKGSSEFKVNIVMNQEGIVA